MNHFQIYIILTYFPSTIPLIVSNNSLQCTHISFTKNISVWILRFHCKSGNSVADVPRGWKGIRPKWRKTRRTEARKPNKMACGESFPGCIDREENSTICHVLIQTVSPWQRKEREREIDKQRKKEREREVSSRQTRWNLRLEFANKWNLSDPFFLSKWHSVFLEIPRVDEKKGSWISEDLSRSLFSSKGREVIFQIILWTSIRSVILNK